MYSKKHFPQQKPGEEIIYFLRRHWIVPLRNIAISLLLAAIPLGFYYVFLSGTTFLDSDVWRALYVLGTSSFYLFVILFTFTNFIDYYLDVWIVTNQRIINIEQKGLFGREVSEKDLGRMQDITANVKGIWATILKYGDLHIQTAGEQQRFVFKQVPHAEDLTREISNIVSNYRVRYGDDSLDGDKNQPPPDRRGQ